MPVVRLELTLLAESDFESDASTISPHRRCSGVSCDFRNVSDLPEMPGIDKAQLTKGPALRHVGAMTWLAHYPEPLPLFEGSVVAVGNFDGVHDGHRSLLAAARDEAMARGLPLVVLTFEPHPRTVLRPDVPLKRLSTLDEKVALLGGCGVNGVAVLGFTPDVAGWSPDIFMDDVLVGWLKAKVVCVGENFRFGKKAAGDSATLAADGRFMARIVPLLADAQGIVSSSRLRTAT